MAVFLPNTTCDIYRNNSTLSAAGVACKIQSVFEHALKVDEHVNPAKKYSHILMVDYTVDIRDGYSYGIITAANQDKVYVPDASGTLFLVVFVQRENNVKRVYLKRQGVSWPSNEV
ncbi:MAG: hypothetical protein HY040_01095 [Planctomycetes bacterium]|nr:hypothetical protein [Planctomycetota bacterium]